jgi:uncharacterized protein YfbU (UPF0304 family)
MRLSNPEKLILLMLSDVCDKLAINEYDTGLIKTAIYTDNSWALDWEFGDIIGSDHEDAPQEVSDVVCYLDMWDAMEESFSSYDQHELNIFWSEMGSKIANLKFPGFDGGSESKFLSISSMLINRMGRFSRFMGRDLNSHYPTTDGYSKMFSVFITAPGDSYAPRRLSPQFLASILKAPKS